MGQNPAEQFVFELCQKSFLRLWSYANPQGKNASKKLCDVLIVCTPDVAILSVKDISPASSGHVEVDWQRWQRRAVEESTKQIYGAQRHIRSAPYVIRSDGSPGFRFPPTSELRVHRIAIAAGSKGEVPIPFGDFGKGFVHVLDEVACRILLRELDTVTDFTMYLAAKEEFCGRVKSFVQVREEDLLALYIHGGRRFPEVRGVLMTPGYLWEEITKKPEFEAKKRADRVSYVWDGLIDTFAQDVLSGNLEP